jgi:glycosyltransferase involved in cell wall biosynthesis
MVLPAPSLTIVIPAFNEAAVIGSVVASVRELCGHFVQEIIVVDDGSQDETAGVAERAGARVIRHRQNQGYGAALKTGIRQATTEFVLTMDSDGQHRAADIPRFLEMAAEYDMVVGQRLALIHSPLWRMPGKWLLGLMANYLTRRRIPDLNSGFRLIRREVALRYLHICPAGFSFSTTITMALLNRGYQVRYLPIQVNERVGRSTVSVKAGFQTIILVLRIATLFDPLRIFIPGSLLIGTTGVLWGVPYALAGRGISVGAMLAIVTAIFLFGLGLLSDQISQMRLERFE